MFVGSVHVTATVFASSGNIYSLADLSSKLLLNVLAGIVVNTLKRKAGMKIYSW